MQNCGIGSAPFALDLEAAARGLGARSCATVRSVCRHSALEGRQPAALAVRLWSAPSRPIERFDTCFSLKTSSLDNERIQKRVSVKRSYGRWD